MKKRFTYTNLGYNGRLGNQLWQIAWLLGKQSEGFEIFLDKKWEYQDYFSLDETIYEETVEPVKNIDGGWHYFQDLTHWEHCENLIRKNFKPSELSLTQLLSRYPQWFFDPTVNKTSIHCRRGDYLNAPEKFYNIPERYYWRAIERIENTDTTYLVFSDDADYARSVFVGDNFYIVEGIETPVLKSDRINPPQDQYDLFIMSLCDNHIIANSTFSWWGAYLSETTNIIYPSIWYGDKMDVKDSFGVNVKESWTKAMKQDWIRVDAS